MLLKHPWKLICIADYEDGNKWHVLTNNHLLNNYTCHWWLLNDKVHIIIIQVLFEIVNEIFILPLVCMKILIIYGADILESHNFNH